MGSQLHVKLKSCVVPFFFNIQLANTAKLSTGRGSHGFWGFFLIMPNSKPVS